MTARGDEVIEATGYGRKQAVRMGRAMRDWDVTWFEEPVSSDDLNGLREVRDQVPADVAVGEYGYDLPYFARIPGFGLGLRDSAADQFRVA